MLSNLTTLATITLAQEGDAGSANPIASLLPFLLIGVVFYLLIIRPQKKRQQAQQAMVQSVGVGDDVVTIGGIHGTVVGVEDDTMQLELAPGVTVTMARNAVSKRVSDATPMDDIDLDEDGFDDDDGLGSGSFDSDFERNFDSDPADDPRYDADLGTDGDRIDDGTDGDVDNR